MNSIRVFLLRNIRGALLLFIITIIASYSGICEAQGFAGGSGTAHDPWQIETAEQLDNLRNYLGSAHTNRHFVQIADIDLGTPPWNAGQGWEPIGDWLSPFMGHYNGNGHVVNNLYISRDDYYMVALFGSLESASFSNLGITNANITSDYISSILAGETYLSVIENCYTTGTVNGGENAGGLIAINYGDISNSYSVANVSGASYVGGLIGYNEAGSIENCFSSGFVYGFERAGGLIGRSSSYGSVTNSYWNTESSGQIESAGGLGRSTAEMIQQSTYQGWDFVDDWTISEGNSYPALQFQDLADYQIPGPTGLTGTGGNQTIQLSWNEAVQQICFGYNIYRDGELLNPDNLITDTFYTDDQVSNWELYSYQINSIIGMDNEVMESLPSAPVKAASVDFAGGEGTIDNPFLVETAAQLYGVRFAPNAFYTQIADINLDIAPWNVGEGWQAIGTMVYDAFSGVYNGDGYLVSGLFINRPEDNRQGLFGYIDNAEVKNLRILDANITAENYAGILVGMSVNSNIESCSVVGSVSGISGVGGLVGLNISSIISHSYASVYVNGGYSVGGLSGSNQDESFINNCFSSGFVTGYSQVGGLTGKISESDVSNSYSTAEVFGSFRTGGLIGDFYIGTVDNSYSVGLISTGVNSYRVGGLIGDVYVLDSYVNNSFWNMDTSLQTTSAGGEGLTTAQMLQELSFTNWDFDDTWNIIENISYPYLEWQNPSSYAIPALTGLSASSGNGVINLNWDSSTSTPSGYNIYRDGVIINDILVTENEFSDTTFEYWIVHTYYVTAIFLHEGEQLESLASNEVSAVSVDFAGGDGSIEDPYLVETAEQLYGIKFAANASYLQTADIFLDDSNWNDGEGWEPIGSPDKSFAGSYDGNGHVIDGLFINRPGEDYQGLFGYIDDAEVVNIKLSNVSVMGKDFTGGLIGYADNSVIESCTISGQISGHENTGGLIGQINNTSLESCHASIHVSAIDQNTGGLVGHASDSSLISGCSSEGTVTRDDSYSLGGLIGFADNSHVESSKSTCMVQGSHTHTGGLIGGALNSLIENSFSTGDINGRQQVGGLIGGMNNSTVSGCFSTGNVNATYFDAGGFIGQSHGSNLSNSYSTGDVVGSYQNVGGLVGNLTSSIVNNCFSTGFVLGRRGEAHGFVGRYINSQISNCYWNIETSGHTYSPAGEGKSTAQMITGTTYDNWDFQQDWTMIESLSYPYLQWQEVTTMPIPGPTNLSGLPSHETIYLLWDPPINPPLGYRLYKNGSLLNDTALLNEPGYIDNEVNNWEFQSYFVEAVYDVDGKRIASTKSTVAEVSAMNFAGGEGTEQHPYLLSNDEHLYGVGFFLNSNFMQTGDISLSNSEWYDDGGWLPIGETDEKAFRGVFDGNGYSIDGLHINRPEESRQALFAYVNDAVIRNINLTNAYVRGGGSTAGLIARNSESLIDNCHISGTITGTSSSTGGLIAIHSRFSTISNSSSDAEVFGTSNVGGLVGMNFSYSLIESCYSQGSVESSGSAGGLVGWNRSTSTVRNSYSNTDVIGDSTIGGLIGYNSSSVIETSYSTGNVRGLNHYTGGLVGRNEDSFINNCYSTSTVIGNLIVGGLIGIHQRQTNDSYIENCFSNGEVSGNGNVGGLVGATQGHYPVYAYNSYWDIETSGQQSSAGGYGRTTEDMTYPYNPNTYLGWDYSNLWGEDPEYDNNNGYPYLRMEPLQVFAGGDGTEENPWLVETAEQLSKIKLFLGPVNIDKHFRQISDINLDIYPWNSGEGWEPIGYSLLNSFQGTYDGDGFRIQGLFINRPTEGHQALFGFVNRGTVKNIGLTDVNVTGDYRTAGLAGETRSATISSCFATGEVNGSSGLISRISFSTVSNCYSSASVTGFNVAGLIGHSNGSTISDCYSTGSVVAEHSGRGLITFSDNESVIINSYWDVETSGQEESYGGEARTTAEMTYPYSTNTFVDWDFSETWEADISSDVNSGYPYLSWEIRTIPDVAVNPLPEDDEENVSVMIEEVSWRYISNAAYEDPVGFRVYFNETGEFSEEDDFVWIPYFESQSDYSSAAVISDLEYETTYYWQVIPTTVEPDIERKRINTTRMTSQRSTISQSRGGDASNCPVWSFTTESDTSAEEVTNPYVTELKGNYPNPFNPETTISFSIAEESRVKVTIYNIRGQRVKTVTNNFYLQGNHNVVWEGKNSEGKNVSSGIYFYRMETESYKDIKKMMMIK